MPHLKRADLDALKRMVVSGTIGDLLAFRFDGVSVGMAVELACAWKSWPTNVVAHLAPAMSRWATDNPVLADALRLLEDESSADATQADPFAAPKLALHRVPTREFILSSSWDLLVEQYRRALQQQGFGARISRAVAQALHEMVDNVLQHSGPTTNRPARGLWGYYVTEGRTEYAVGDVGVGVLKSLRTTDRWPRLSSDADALDAAVMNRATRRPDRTFGNGFEEVYRSLSDLHGDLHFATGSATLRVRTRNWQREATPRTQPPTPGLQLSICCGAVESSQPLIIPRP